MHDVVVTGCAGFIGSTLCERLTNRGDRVLGIDSFDDYYSPAVKRRNLVALADQSQFKFLEGNLRELPLRRYLREGVRVIHLAAQPGVRGSWGKKFHRYVENNVYATQSILETLTRADVPARFVYASSSSIYGEAPGGPTAEDQLPRPISPYGMTKLAGEHLTRLYCRTGNLTSVCLRFFTVYGPRQRPDMAFHKFFRAVHEDRPIQVYGDGRQIRDFTFVDDIVDGILSAAEAPVHGEVFNLGGGAPVPLETAIKYVGEAAGQSPTIRHAPPQAGDPQATWADIRRARRLLRFRPRVSLREGLKRQWRWQSAEARTIRTSA